MDNIILYFPWGGGGNLVRNIISIDTRFEFSDDQWTNGHYPTADSRYEFLLNYYNKPVEPSTWLPREWRLRAKIQSRYYQNGKIVYWNPEKLLVYDAHGSQSDVINILSGRHLKCFNRWEINCGAASEQLSSWTLEDCTHIFLIPSDVSTITKIYNSKNPTINQLESVQDLARRRQQAEIANVKMCERLNNLAAQLRISGKQVYVYDCAELYRNPNTIKDIVSSMELAVNHNYIDSIHSVWLQSTQQVYYNYFMTTFPI